MPQKVKLNIDELKVQSFVTSLDEKQKQHIKAGLPNTCVTCDLDCSDSRYMLCP